MSANNLELLQACRAAQSSLDESLRHILSLFDTLKQYTLPDPTKSTVLTDSASLKQLIADPSQTGSWVAQELNTQLQQHVSAYQESFRECQAQVALVNQLAASLPAIEDYLKLPSLGGASEQEMQHDGTVSGLTLDEEREYDLLLKEEAELSEVSMQRNAVLQLTLQQLRQLARATQRIAARHKSDAP